MEPLGHFSIGVLHALLRLLNGCGMSALQYDQPSPAAHCQSFICIRTTEGLSLLVGPCVVPVEVVGYNIVRTPAGTMVVGPVVGMPVGNPVGHIVAGMAASRAAAGHVVA